MLDMKRDVILRLVEYMNIPTLRALFGTCFEIYRWKSHPYFHKHPYEMSDEAYYHLFRFFLKCYRLSPTHKNEQLLTVQCLEG